MRILRLLLICPLATLSACNSPSKERSPEPVTPTVQTAEPPLPAKPSKTSAGNQVRELPTYTKLGRQWRAVVVRPDTGREALIGLARELHRADPSSPVRIFTDDAQFAALRAWDENYPSPSHPDPEEWVAKHYLALVNRMVEPGGAKWQLLAADGGMHLLPANAPSSVLADLD